MFHRRTGLSALASEKAGLDMKKVELRRMLYADHLEHSERGSVKQIQKVQTLCGVHKPKELCFSVGADWKD